MQYWKKIIKLFNQGIIIIGLIFPLILFLNRFLIPDVSYDSLNYHLFSGQRVFNTLNNKYEFYPTGIHNYSPILEISGYLLMKVFGYRLGSIGSLIFLYLSIFVSYKIFRLYQPKFKILDYWWSGLFIVNCFFSFEAFLQIAVYLVDLEVLFLSLLCFYLLLKYEKNKNLNYLFFSSLTVGILFLGKMTSCYILPAYFLYLFRILIVDKNLNWKEKFFRLCLSGLFVVFVSIPWWCKNYQKTGNPVFPYYNAIFKSEYFQDINYDQSDIGGDTVIEKIFWGIVTVKNPNKLGKPHDLFNDYKINIYFIITLIIFSWAIIKKNQDLTKLTIFYLISFEIWSYVFGYLRYGIFLEFLGGIILLIWLTKLNYLNNYLIILPIFAIMLLMDIKVISLSTKYDLSFRQGYFYSHKKYFSELVNLNNNSIEIDHNLVKKYNPKIFLNCITPGMSYQVMSEFSDLPVLNIDNGFYIGLTNDFEYFSESQKLIKSGIRNNLVNFVTIVTKNGLDITYEKCVSNLKIQSFKILDEADTSFLGYKDQKLKVIFGQFEL